MAVENMILAGILHPGVLAGRSHIAEHILVVAQQLIIQLQGSLVDILPGAGLEAAAVAGAKAGEFEIGGGAGCLLAIVAHPV